MSNATTLTSTRLGSAKSATAHAARKAACGTRATTSATSAEHERHAKVGDVEERDRQQAVVRAAPTPSRAPRGARRWRLPGSAPGSRTAPPARTGRGSARRSRARRARARRPPRMTHASATSRTAGKRKKWNGASIAPRGRPRPAAAAGRASPPAARGASAVARVSSRIAPTKIGRPSAVARCDEEPGAHHRRDAEVGPAHRARAVVPEVVVAVVG